jgi:hypothetical protein
LARVFDPLSGDPRGQEINDEVLATAAERGRRGNIWCRCAALGGESLMAAYIEPLIALEAIRIGINVGEIIPHTQQMTVTAAINKVKNPAVREESCRFEPALKPHLQAAKKNIFTARRHQFTQLLPHHGLWRGPDFVQGIAIQQRHVNPHIRGARCDAWPLRAECHYSHDGVVVHCLMIIVFPGR